MTTKNNKQFLEEKMNNFKVFLRTNGKNLQKIDEIDKQPVETWLVFAGLTLMPMIQKPNGLEECVQKAMEAFEMTDTEEVRGKMKRYFEFLVAFLLELKKAEGK